MNNFVPPKRWYDRHPKLSQSVKLMIILPDEIQSILSEGIMILANKEFCVNEKVNSFKTLGADKVLGLHKSKNKRREYDKNPQLHKAMNYLYILSEENQDSMADHIVSLVSYIQEYLKSCYQFQSDPSIEDVAEITTLYISRGTRDVEEFLARVRYEIQQRVLRGTPYKPPVDFLEQGIAETNSGLQLKGHDKPTKPE